jgi:hypothetical protein
VEDDIGSRANDASTSRYERKQVAMDPQSAEISPVTFVRRESAAISVAMESSLAADAAPLTSDNGSERRAFSIGEVQKMTCPRCLHTFPVEFYVSSAATYPRARKTDDPGMFVMSEKQIEQGQINWIRQQNEWRRTTD